MADLLTVVVRRYGLSAVGLAKICRTLAIFLSSRGYWAKVKAEKSMERVPFPEHKQVAASKTGLVKLPPEQTEIRKAYRSSR